MSPLLLYFGFVLKCTMPKFISGLMGKKYEDWRQLEEKWCVNWRENGRTTNVDKREKNDTNMEQTNSTIHKYYAWSAEQNQHALKRTNQSKTRHKGLKNHCGKGQCRHHWWERKIDSQHIPFFYCIRFEKWKIKLILDAS